MDFELLTNPFYQRALATAGFIGFANGFFSGFLQSTIDGGIHLNSVAVQIILGSVCFCNSPISTRCFCTE